MEHEWKIDQYASNPFKGHSFDGSNPLKSTSSSNDGSSANLRSSLPGNGSRFNDYANRFSSIGSTLSQSGMNTVNTSLANMLRNAQVSEADMVADATQDVNSAFSRAGESAARNLSRMGINANSGRFVGMEKDLSLARAAAEAGARNKARIQARQQQFGNYGQIAGIGSNLVGHGMNALNSSANHYNNYMNYLNDAESNRIAGIQANNTHDFNTIFAQKSGINMGR